MLSLFLIALSLNFDTFSVAIVEGAEAKRRSFKQSLRIGLYFGIGQAMMALLGAIFGLGFQTIISDIDHWIAFFLLSAVGGKMIYEFDKKDKSSDSLCAKTLICLVVATSIDALIIGITFAFLKQSIVTSVIIIGLISFIASFTGYFLGDKLKLVFRNKIKIIGGIILILLGIKILIEHLIIR